MPMSRRILRPYRSLLWTIKRVGKEKGMLILKIQNTSLALTDDLRSASTLNMLPVSDFALGLNIHAQDYLFDSARDTTLNSLAFEDNGSSLTDVMRNALSNSSITRSWDFETETDFGTNDLIHTFAEQIDDMNNNIITNATMLLDEIELYLSSTNNVTGTFQDVEMSGGGFRFNESSLGLHLNISLVSADAQKV